MYSRNVYIYDARTIDADSLRLDDHFCSVVKQMLGAKMVYMCAVIINHDLAKFEPYLVDMLRYY